MPIYWQTDAQKTLIIEFDENWDWNMFYKSIREGHRLIATAAHSVDLILLHKVELPKGNPLVHFKNAMNDQPKNIGRVVVVNTKMNAVTQTFMTMLASVLEKVNPSKNRVQIVATLDEANRLLNAVK
jgi:hypothetical protein